MANVTKVVKHGSVMLVMLDDGSKIVANPTSINVWIASINASVPPPPGGSGDWQWPFPLDVVTSEFQPPDRPNHNGMDFSGGPAVMGAPIPCAGNGTVYLTASEGNYGGYGNVCVVDHGTVNGHWSLTLYAHMDTFPVVSVGQTVVRGQTLGPVGNTGNSYGAHLHFETWVDGDNTGYAINPRDFLGQFGL